MLDIGIIVDRIGDNVMNVVCGLPPSRANTIGDAQKERDSVIKHFVVGDGIVEKVMRNE